MLRFVLSDIRSRRPAATALALLGIGAVIWGAWRAHALWWTADDAYISFRYARNLVEGLGLVFNAGERVEGYTNPLWTLWSAAGLAVGADASSWANAWGIAFYAGAILLLAANALRRKDARSFVPLAALGAAFHEDWSGYATSGLETSCFTFLLLAGALLVSWGRDRPAMGAGAGIVFGLASLTRPDGILPAFVVGLYLLAFARPRWRIASIYAGAFAALWLPFTLWRLSYYGDFFPNTYYAKSAYLAWYEQGWRYLWLYGQRYWVLLVVPPALAAVASLARPAEAPRSTTPILYAAIAIAYTWYVVRVGGDFMFARMLIPVTPFLLLLLEEGWSRAFRGRAGYGSVAAALAVAGLLFTPSPVPPRQWVHGISDERAYYSPERVARLEHKAEVLKRYLEGLPVRVAFYGTEAILAYRARFPVAIECDTGLTDPVVARQSLVERGRVGHEKHATPSYLIDERRVHFHFSNVGEDKLPLRGIIPTLVIRLDEGVLGRVLHWDPVVMATLASRGADIPDFFGALDRYIANIDSTPQDEVAGDFRRLERFYFRYVDDPLREAAFRRRLGSGG